MAEKTTVLMEKKRFSYKRAVQRIYNYLADAIEQGKTLQRISEGLRNIVNSYAGLNRDERYRIYLDSYNAARAVRYKPDALEKFRQKQYFDSISTSCRVAKSHLNLREKKAQIRTLLDDDSQIFFICSVHEKPAKDHADWQGLIYVDRFWRTKVSEEMRPAVQSYIRNHQILTVQEIMGEPVYLTTRPNCKHFFIPLETKEVLHSSIKKIRKEIGYRKDTPYTVQEREALYKQIWDSIDNK